MADERLAFFQRMHASATSASQLISQLDVVEADLTDAHREHFPDFVARVARPEQLRTARPLLRAFSAVTDDLPDDIEQDGDPNLPIFPGLMQSLLAALGAYGSSWDKTADAMLVLNGDDPIMFTEERYWDALLDVRFSDGAQATAAIPIVAYDEMHALFDKRPLLPPLTKHQEFWEQGFALIAELSEVYHRLSVEVKGRLKSYWNADVQPSGQLLFLRGLKIDGDMRGEISRAQEELSAVYSLKQGQLSFLAKLYSGEIEMQGVVA